MRQTIRHTANQLSRFDAGFTCSAAFKAFAILCVGGLPALAEVPLNPVDPNLRTVSLVAQDSSDCANSTVQDDPNRIRGGELWVTRGANGTMHVQVAMT